MYYVQSEEYVQTGNFSAALISGGATIVDRRSGKQIQTGSGNFSEDELVANYEKFGNPFVYEEVGRKLILKSWESGASAISAMILLRTKNRDLSLSQAKYLIDQCLEGNSPVASTDSPDEASELVCKLRELGFIAEQVIERRGPK